MVLVQAENLSPPLCISSQCKMQGDCQWGRMEGQRREAYCRQQTFTPQAVHMFSGVLDLWVTVYIPEDSIVF